MLLSAKSNKLQNKKESALSQAARVFKQRVLPNKWFQAACIAALVFIIYFVTSERSTAFDQYVRLADAFLHGRLYLVDAPSWLELARYGDKAFVIDPPAPALFLIPWVAIWGLNTNQVIVSIILGAVATGFFWVAATQIGWSFRFRISMTVLVAFGTNFWWAATDGSLWTLANVSAVFFLMAALVETTGKNRPLLVGLLVGLAGLSRLPVFLTFPFFAYAVTRTKSADIRWSFIIRRLAFFGLALGVMGAIYLVYNYGRFGTISDMGYYASGYSSEPWFSKGRFDISYIPRHINAILFQGPVFSDEFPFFKPSSAGLGLFFTTPALLYIFRSNLKDRLVLAAVVGTLTAAAIWVLHGTTGWSQFGYRYSLDALPLLIIMAASGMNYRLDRFKVAIIVLCCCINLWGVLTYP